MTTSLRPGSAAQTVLTLASANHSKAPPLQVSRLFPVPAGFALQAYRGAQKPTAMEVMKSQASRLADNSAAQAAPPKMEIPTVEARRHGARPHKLRHRDMNVLTPSGF